MVLEGWMALLTFIFLFAVYSFILSVPIFRRWEKICIGLMCAGAMLSAAMRLGVLSSG